jgi:hypothetical protein
MLIPGISKRSLQIFKKARAGPRPDAGSGSMPFSPCLVGDNILLYGEPPCLKIISRLLSEIS